MGRETFKLLQNMPLEVTISKGLCESNDEFWVCFVITTGTHTLILSRYCNARELASKAELELTLQPSLPGEAKSRHYIMKTYNDIGIIITDSDRFDVSCRAVAP